MAWDRSVDAAHETDRRIALAREWDDLVEQVRKLDGFADFLRPPRLETLLPAAEDGPVVIVNVSSHRCDALAVTTGGVEVVELPALTAAEVADQVRSYVETIEEIDTAVRQLHADVVDIDGGVERDAEVMLTARHDVESRIRGTLSWMWDRFVAHILDQLALSGPPGEGAPWPRLWWCPIGPLAMLPLHAAGHHETVGDAVLDRVVSSYTPTLRALMQARRPRPHRDEEDRMLVVSLPDTVGHQPLPQVRRETALLQRLFRNYRLTELTGAAATQEAVRQELPRHSWVHFSCHGGQDMANPWRARLQMHDGPLTITDLSSHRYQGDFACLSACKTATGGGVLPDEAISLAAALHYTGYQHVIATLWSVYDAIAAGVTERVYTDLFVHGTFDPERSATALHHAVRWLRNRVPTLPSVWTPFTHIGP